MPLPDRPDWTDEFQRVVLRTVCESDWPLATPFSADLFGSLDDKSRIPAPRQRIAQCLESWWQLYTKPPGLVMTGQMIEQALTPLAPAERAPVQHEWALVRAMPVPATLDFIIHSVVAWTRWRSFSTTLLRAADLLSRGPESVEAAADAVTQGLVTLTPPDAASTEQRFVSGFLDRLKEWERGEDPRSRVATGFAPLDRTLHGGPMRGESFYVLAPPKGAKTTILVKLALAALRQRLGVYFVSFEMRANRVLRRADRGVTGLNEFEIQKDPQRLITAIRAMQATSPGDLYVKEASPLEPRAVESVIRRVKELRNDGATIDLVVLDYLNIMGSSKQEREKRHELARISREISALAKELNVVTWSAALVNRQAVNRIRPSKTDIAEAFEVLAVLDGAIAVFGPARWRRPEVRLRGLYATALRESEDDVMCGVYKVDLGRLEFEALSPEEEAAAMRPPGEAGPPPPEEAG